MTARSGGHALFVVVVVAATTAATARAQNDPELRLSFRLGEVFPLLLAQAQVGCSKDTDCKGDRICVQGDCVSPAPNPALMAAPPPPPTAAEEAPAPMQQTAETQRPTDAQDPQTMSTGKGFIGAGAGLLGGGVALVLVGAVLVLADLSTTTYQCTYTQGSTPCNPYTQGTATGTTNSNPYAAAGTALMVVGVVAAAAGAALLTVGIIKKVKYKRAVEAWGHASIQYAPNSRTTVLAWSATF